MKLVLTSDLHGTLPDIPECDLLIIAGDVTPVWNHERRYQAQWLRRDFSDWLVDVPADHIVGVGGNHDFVLEDSKVGYELPWQYIRNEHTSYGDLRIFGSPYSNRFMNWAFMSEENELATMYDKIRDDVDILITHGPAYGYGDRVPDRWLGPGQDPHVGSTSLAHQLESGRWPNLKLHVYGHIHEAYGEYRVKNREGLRSLNVSLLDDRYVETHKPVEIEL